MANDEDLTRIRQGVTVWNAWRAQDRDRLVNLGGAADLEEANVSWANLKGAKLEAANLGGADLREADLGKAKDSGASSPFS